MSNRTMLLFCTVVAVLVFVLGIGVGLGMRVPTAHATTQFSLEDVRTVFKEEIALSCMQCERAANIVHVPYTVTVTHIVTVTEACAPTMEPVVYTDTGSALTDSITITVTEPVSTPYDSPQEAPPASDTGDAGDDDVIIIVEPIVVTETHTITVTIPGPAQPAKERCDQGRPHSEGCSPGQSDSTVRPGHPKGPNDEPPPESGPRPRANDAPKLTFCEKNPGHRRCQ